ncbi:unnamed protein product [Spodoptera exigua]|nr:unnamed protein product [Spodoptera exigua]
MRKRKDTCKVNVDGQPVHLSLEKIESKQYSEQVFLGSPTMPSKCASVVDMLDEDPFDYDIVNIDTTLLNVNEGKSFEMAPLRMKRSIVGGSLVYKQQPMFTDSVSSIYLSKVIKPQKKFVHHKKENLTVQGKNNAFMIELFAIREDIDDRSAAEIDFIRGRYNLDSYQIHKYHYMGHGIRAGFATIKCAVLYPVFEPHFRFFAREMMRLSGNDTLLWLTAYRNKWTIHKANSIVASMVPLTPRNIEFDCEAIPELKKICLFTDKLIPFSTWFIGRKFTTIPKADVNTRIVIIGGAATALAFLNGLLFRNNLSTTPYISLDKPRFSDTEIQIANDETPENVFIVNSVVEANKALDYVKKFVGDDSKKVIVYGSTIHAYLCVNALLDIKLNPENIIFVESFPPEHPEKARVSVFDNETVDQTVINVLDNLKVKVYRSFYFKSWSVTIDDVITHADFLSYSGYLKLECSAFFYYGKIGVNMRAFIAIHKSGLAYDGGVVIDHECRTLDPYVYAAGPCTRYHKRYYADARSHKYYDSEEIGEKLGIQIRKQLDPLFSEAKPPFSHKWPHEEFMTFHKEFDLSATLGAFRDGPLHLSDYARPEMSLLPFNKPKVSYCVLPGGLKYLEVRSPGLKTPHNYVQSLDYNGFVFETYKTGYFKIHLNRELVVDGVTCLSQENYSLENFKRLYGRPASELNNMHLRYMANKLDDFFEFFRLPWAFFLYHDHADDLLAMIKQLYPKGQVGGITLKEALFKAAEKMACDSPKITTPLPKRATGRDMVVEKESYKTTTGEYCVKPNPNKAMERSDCAINCKRVCFMTGVEKRLQAKNIIQPTMISEMKDNFRGLTKSPLAPPDTDVRSPDPEFIFDAVAAGRNETPVIFDDAKGGYRKLLDPYVSTYRTYHRPFTPDDQYGIGAKDHITFYSESSTPKVKGFGPRHKEIWMPLTAKVHRGVYDRIHVKKEYKEVSASHNPVKNLKGAFISETMKKYKTPFAISSLASWDHGEVFDLAPFPPNPYQTNIAPFMYCSDYCHIAQGTPPYTVIDQFAHNLPPHKKCVKRFIVSSDY